LFNNLFLNNCPSNGNVLVHFAVTSYILFLSTDIPLWNAYAVPKNIVSN